MVYIKGTKIVEVKNVINVFKVTTSLVGHKVKPDEDKLPEKTRDCLQRVRLDLLQDIYAWDRERQAHLPLVYAISDLLEHPRYAGWAAKILRKLGHKVTWRDGRYHAKIRR